MVKPQRKVGSQVFRSSSAIFFIALLEPFPVHIDYFLFFKNAAKKRTVIMRTIVPPGERSK